jgi:hypothetical protein
VLCFSRFSMYVFSLRIWRPKRLLVLQGLRVSYITHFLVRLNYFHFLPPSNPSLEAKQPHPTLLPLSYFRNLATPFWEN